MAHGRHFHSRVGRGLAGLSLAVVLAACGQQNTYAPPPPPKVTVASPVQQPVTRYLEATGNVAAVNTVDLVARVQGFLATVNFQDGATVKRGDLLFTIEPEPYKLKLDQAQAAEAAAQAALTQTEADYKRQSDLLGRQVATQATLDQSLANRDSARAKLQQAQVDTKLAAIQYDYTQVKAPFDGTMTSRLVSVGELVGSAGPTILATIVQSDPIYVNFNVNERDLQGIRADMARQGLTRDDLKKVPVEIGLQTETGYPHRGTLDYAAPNVNPATGTLAVRGILQNADRPLLPGYFARVRVPTRQDPSALLVPDSALGADQGGRYVLVVNKDNVVEQRKVEVGPLVGELRVIDKGLTADDRVVVTGLLRAVPGQKLDPQPATLAPGATQPK